MKVLVIYTNEFSYLPNQKNLPDAEETPEGTSFAEAILAMIQVEESDEQNDVASRGKKLSNHLKWACRKNNCMRVVLHSFAHLSDSKASAPFTKDVFNDTESRLRNVGYEVAQTPFGYFLDLNIKAPGYSLARIWANL